MTERNKNWSELTGDEKVSWIEAKKEWAREFSDSEFQSYIQHQAERKKRIKRHVKALVELRAS